MNRAAANKAAKRAARQKQLDKISAARNRERSALDDDDSDDEGKKTYDVVTEEEYHDIVRARREEDDFVVDDDGLGYADTGEEFIGVSEEKRNSNKKSKVHNDSDDSDNSDDDEKKKKKRRINSITQYTKPGVMNTNTMSLSTKSKTNIMATHQAEIDIDAMLDVGKKKKKSVNMAVMNASRYVDVDAAARIRGGINASLTSSSSSSSSNISFNMSTDYGGYDGGYDDGPDLSSTMDDDNNNTIDVNVNDDDNTTKDKEQPAEIQKRAVNRTSKKLKGSAAMQRSSAASGDLADFDTEHMITTNVNDISAAAFGGASGNNSSSTTSETTSLSAANIDARFWLKSEPAAKEGETETKYVNMYWTDATEVKGDIYVFGKIPIEEPNQPIKYVSGCLKVEGNERSLFVLPKAIPGKYDKDNKQARAPMNEVYEEVKNMLVPKYVSRQNNALKCRPVDKKYAFELREVPREETQYLQVKYSAKNDPLPKEMCHNDKLKNIERIFGAQQTPLELFLLERKLMGPGWLKIKAPKIPASKMGYCKLELVASNPMFVEKCNRSDKPKLVTMSVSVKTICNPRTHTNELVALGAVVHTGVEVDGDSSEDQRHMKRFTYIRQLGTSCGDGFPHVWPHDLENMIKEKCKGLVDLCPNERGMIAKFFARVQNEDPDVLVSHNLFGFEFDILLKRALQHNLATWNRLGRLNKSTKPRSITDRDVAAGRLLCDTYTMSKEFVRETTYSLSALCKSQLKVERQEVDPQDVPRYFHDSNNIIRLASHTQSDAMLVQRMMLKLQIIPLTKQLTTCSGNLWSRTLRGQRAERIEYLLSHEFHALGYVLPEKKGFDNNINDKTKKKSKSKSSGGNDGDDDGDNQVGGMSRKRGKAAYAGGLVLEPKKGLYDTYVLLLDFNSLYPSIIQEFNLCFTTIHDWANFLDDNGDSATPPPVSIGEGEGEEDVEAAVAASGGSRLPEIPSINANQGILPRVIKELVDKRKQVKDMLKKERDPVKKKQYDIRQKALKLTANSMYGCLGFSFSRFYARPIAALVTSKGREALQRTVDIATNTLGLNVIYGDTDSVMINTGSTDLKHVKEVASKVMAEVNKLYKALVLDMDGIFKSMLLLKKKKYAAVTITEVDGKEVLDVELKGLDLVRRDWCPLSKDTGKAMVDDILSGKPRDEIVDSIHDRLRSLAEDARKGIIPMEQFIVTKGLNKLPKDYPDIKGQAHLQVALRMVEQGRPVNVGDHIPYVICVQGEEGATAPQRARHPDEVKRSQGEYTLDIEWYLGSQILPPVSRLCEPIEGTSQQQLAQCLGLDDSKYVSRSANDDLDFESWGFTPKSRLEDSERFKECVKLTCKCRKCQDDVEFIGCFNSDGLSGLSCPKCNAKYYGRDDAVSSYAHISNRVTLLVNKMVQRYYDCWLKCDDATCGERTRQQSVMGYACKNDCHGRMVAEFNEDMLYTQLKYLETLFDFDRACKKRGIKENELIIKPEDKEVLSLLRKHLSNAVQNSSYNWIRPSLWTVCFGGAAFENLKEQRMNQNNNNNGITVAVA